jgi:hypothetical protein
MESPASNTSYKWSCHVERSETSLACFGDRMPQINQRFFFRDCGIRMTLCDGLYDLT